jgi:sarcosine oxidase subunit gamma
VSIGERPFGTQLSLRLDPDGASAATVAGVLGRPLPTQPSTWVSAPSGDVLWLGPDEWLLLVAATRADLEASLRAALAGAAGAVVDVSAQRTTIALSGPGARSVLAHGCAIDLHPRVAPNGTCVQTLLARTGVIVVVDDAEAESFRLLVRSSFAAYLAASLVDAGTELD